MNDNVNHPLHYTQGGVECIDALKASTVGKKGIEAVCVANVIKYLWRYEEKNGLEDVKKAQWYLNQLIQELEEKINNSVHNNSINNNEDISCSDCKFYPQPINSEPCIHCKNSHSILFKKYEIYPLKFQPNT